MSCGISRRRGSDLALLWLWGRPAATALILPLAWERPYAVGMALKRQKQPKTSVQGFLFSVSLAAFVILISLMVAILTDVK